MNSNEIINLGFIHTYILTAVVYFYNYFHFPNHM